jgi:hypothetical protein
VKSSGTRQRNTCFTVSRSHVDPSHDSAAYLAIVGTRCDQRVIEGVPIVITSVSSTQKAYTKRCSLPVSVQDSGGVSSKQGYFLRDFSSLLQGDDGECTAATSFPVDCQVLGIDLCNSQTIYATGQQGQGTARTFSKLVSHALRDTRRLS